MENSLVKIGVNEIMSIGKAFVESGMFPDIKTAAQAVVKIQAGQELGVAPFAAMTGIHIIQGRPTLGAGLIASKVKASGKYDYKILEMDEKKCSIDFYQGKEKIGNSTFTLEDAKKAGTKNMDKFPKNMLFARAISNGVKWFTPDVFNGPVYTPEELEQKTEDVAHEELPAPVYPKETEKKTNGLVKQPSKLTDEEEQAVGQWLDKINECKTEEELKKVFTEGKGMINSNPTLFSAKEKKKKELLQTV